MCYSAEKLVKDSGDKIDSSDKEALNQKIEELRKKLGENNPDEINKCKDELQKQMFDISTKLYQQNPQPSQEQPQGAPAEDGENVYDTQYKDVNDNGNKE
jgi:molecular chaperone DnaK